MMLIEHTPKKWAEFVKTRNPTLESIVPLRANGSRDWKSMGDDAIIAHSRWMIEDEGIRGRQELLVKHSGIYFALRRRNLLDETGLPNTQKSYRNWVMGDDELIDYATRFIGETEVRSRRELAKADGSLYHILWEKKLLDRAGLPNSNEGDRDWAGMGADELVCLAKVYIAEKGIAGRLELEKANRRLYRALHKRELIGETGLAKRQRQWAGMGDEELVRHAKEFNVEMEIRGRRHLAKVDSGLYCTLRMRKLMDAVFADIESSNHKGAVDGVLDALESFGDEK